MIIFIAITLFLAGLCWGSFLNCFAHRILHNKNLFTMRSMCPSCHQMIAWYDNIPVLSWFVLHGKCRWCKVPISGLYPFIELVTAILLPALFLQLVSGHNLFFFIISDSVSFLSFLCYFFFFSALITATRTDLEAMVIPQCFSLWLIPVALCATIANWINISFIQSVSGAFLGYGILWIVARGYSLLKHQDGLGKGDMELLAMIGSFLGPLGVWTSLMIGSIIGLGVGVAYLLWSGKEATTRIPFGPFLALGATIHFFFGTQLAELLLFR